MQMKYILLIAVVLLGLQACKKDSNDVSPVATIVGKWYLKKYQTRSFKNNALTRDTARTNFTPADFEVFDTDGSGYTSNLTPGGETAVIRYNYTLNGTVLVINHDTPAFYAGTYTIIQLTENTLEVSYESWTVINGDHYHGIDNIRFKKE